MTLQRHTRFFTGVLCATLALVSLLGLVTLWRWAYRFDELAFLPAGIQGWQLSGAVLLALWLQLAVVAVAAVPKMASYVLWLATSTTQGDAPLVQSEYAEVVPAEDFPSPHTVYPRLASAVRDARLDEMQWDARMIILRLLAALLTALLAVGVLPFHGLLFPALNIASAVCLAINTLALFARSAWRWLNYPQRWIGAVERATRFWPQAAVWRALVEASLALVGGALGSIAVYSAPAMKGDPPWIKGKILMMLGIPTMTVVGWLLARRAWRRLRHG